jgi:hypothetical protein
MIYKEKQFSCYLYDQMDQENEALHPDNPRNFMDSLSPLISAMVSREVGTVLYEDLAGQFGSEYIDRMIRCGVLRREGQRVYLDTPVFLESDASVLADHFASAAGKITDLIMSCRQPLYELAGKINNGFSPERNLYHLLCGWSMDGAMIDRLIQEDIISEGRPHPTGLDYLLILYEKSPALDAFSDRLLCSFNRCVQEDCALESFGDADGNRLDCFRYFRLKEQGKLTPAFDSIHEAMKGLSAADLTRAARSLASGQEADIRAVRALEAFGYVRNGKPCVPVFMPEHDVVFYAIEELIEKVLLKPVANVFEGMRDLRITPSLHRVPLKETANECWHILFGSTNEALVNNGFVSPPEACAGEGRYLRCIVLS